jgi:hypothetical protein
MTLRSQPNSLRWFIGTGVAGLLVSALILVAGHFGGSLPWPWGYLLWPTAIYGLRFDNDFVGALHAAPVMFGGQFLLYGLWGLLARWIVYAIAKLTGNQRISN